MTNDQIESEFKHLATKADLGLLKTNLAEAETRLERAMREQLRWMIGLQLPTWLGLFSLLLVLLLKGH
jgi:hypothetical protein